MDIKLTNETVDDLSDDELIAIENNRSATFIRLRAHRLGIPLACAPIASLRELFERLREGFGY